MNCKVNEAPEPVANIVFALLFVLVLIKVIYIVYMEVIVEV